MKLHYQTIQVKNYFFPFDTGLVHYSDPNVFVLIKFFGQFFAIVIHYKSVHKLCFRGLGERKD